MKTTAQLRHLLAFELFLFSKRILFYLVLVAFLGMGFFCGSSLSAFSTENVFRNSPFAITYILGYLSLFCIFLTTIVAAQVLFREEEHRFSMVLYATPLKKINFFLSRFLIISGVSALALFLLVTGFMIGQQMSRFDASEFGPFHIWYYYQPFLLLTLPNTVFCSAVVCSIGLLTKNKLLVYVSGLFVFIAYQVALIFSGSPLIAGSMPPTEASMQLAALLDPFGLSAFLQQTLQWSAVQRNTMLASLGGAMLFNRALYMGLSFLLLIASYHAFRFSVDIKRRKMKETTQTDTTNRTYRVVTQWPSGIRYRLTSLTSLVKIDLIFVLKSIPFLLILVGIMFFVSMEMYGAIEQGVRIPQQYVSSGLMVNTILEIFPTFCSLVILFYSNELLWRSRISNFHLIENTTPVNLSSGLFARWFSMAVIILLLLAAVAIMGLTFQLVYQYPHIEWITYISIGYLTGLPLLLSSGIIIAIQQFFRNRYVALVAATIYMLLTTTCVGTALHIKHPLLRTGSAFNGEYSAMNGFGAFIHPFNWRMLFGICLVLIIMILTIQIKQNNRKKWRLSVFVVLIVLMTGAVSTGVYVNNRLDLTDSEATLSWQAGYEKKYRPFQDLPQPAISKVSTRIDLYPENNSYEVTASYMLFNNTDKPITRLLFYVNPGISLKSMKAGNQKPDITDTPNGHYWVQLTRPLQPNDSLTAHFEFGYSWNTFNRLASFNAIVENGAFMRISNYFPRLGYQPDNEIADAPERTKRRLGAGTPMKNPKDPERTAAEWLTLDMQISTSAGQTAIGIGELVNSYRKGNRNYFHYKTDVPVRFRFGVSSARYAVRKVQHRDISLEVYYHPAHPENVEALIANAKNTLDYCEANFGKYPFKTARFAEVSAFTRGFAATAYPATVFMTENMVFHANIKGDNQQDVINELAGHELSHEWWGTNQFVPDNREGSGVLSETLAMYTELMLVKKMYGRKRVLENVKMYRNMYLSERGFGDEQPLYRSKPENTYLLYYKGLVSMYQLSELIGEEKVNVALRNLYQKNVHKSSLPVSTDLLNELYAVSEVTDHPAIDDLFKRIIIFQPSAKNIHTRRNRNQYETGFEIAVNKYAGDGKGKQTLADFNGTIEIGFYWPDGHEQIMSFPVRHNKAFVRVIHRQKPVSFSLDPNERLMKSDENTHYQLK